MSDAGEEISERILVMSLQEFSKWSKKKFFEALGLGSHGIPPKSDLKTGTTLSEDVWKDLEPRLREEGIGFEIKRVDARSVPPSITIATLESDVAKLSDLQSAVFTERLARGETTPEPGVGQEKEEKVPDHVAEAVEELDREGVDMTADVDKDASTVRITMSSRDGSSLVPHVMKASERAGVTPPAVVEEWLSPAAAEAFRTVAVASGLEFAEDGVDAFGDTVAATNMTCLKVPAESAELHARVLGLAAERASESGREAEAQELRAAGQTLGERKSVAEEAVHGSIALELGEEERAALADACAKNGAVLVDRGMPGDGADRKARVLVSQKDAVKKAFDQAADRLGASNPAAAERLRETGRQTVGKMRDEEASRKPWMKNKTTRAKEASIATEKTRAFAKDKNRDFER